ncbi:MAG TPA: glycosyltransferase [Casimicrobiaceae bacterium]|nr:glycosyltransferase [Casimicrobiaceae bacterium]
MAAAAVGARAFVVAAHGAFVNGRDTQQKLALESDATTLGAPMDIVVPIYNAAADVERCVGSVLAHTTPPYRLVLIDDASPDPAVAQVLERIRAMALRHVALVRNDTNLGFIGTANRGMFLSTADVVLLNSDTVVTAGWLDALRRCAASNPSFGTITPFSNNAEICSFPRFCENNPWPEGADPEPVRAMLAHAAVPTYPDLPTGVGFCMYVRRALIEAIGAFDPVFGRGYGEENDFCLRAFAVGYRNVLCDDAFVLHLGGRSFQDHKASLGRRNLDILLERHPHYERMVQDFIAADPLRPIRETALSWARAHAGDRRGILHVIHGHGGGTEHHVRALIDASRTQYRHYLVVALEERWQVEEHLDDASVRRFEFRREQDETWAQFVAGLCATFAIDLVHLHNISGCREGLLAAMAALRLPYGYTVHDVNFGCPTITFLGRDGMYCGGETDPARCGACLAAQSSFAGIDIVDWRARHARLLAKASFVIAPSQWAAGALEHYFPDVPIDVVPHAAPGVWASDDDAWQPAGVKAGNARVVVLLPDDDVPTVAVLGAIGPDKGARRLERLVELARARDARVRFVLIGYMDREHGPWQSDDARFTIGGHYRARDLPDLLDHYRAELVVFPSAGPETFSFTLSEAWAAGRPVLVPPIGALAERVAGTDAGWIWNDAQWRSEELMLDAILARLADRDALRHAGERGRRIVQATPAVMAQRTTAIYARIQPDANVAAASQPLDRARVRDALGYQLWYPPIPERIAAPAVASAPVERTADAATVVAPAPVAPRLMLRVATRLRGTRMGKLLRDLAPAPLRHALRERLLKP